MKAIHHTHYLTTGQLEIGSAPEPEAGAGEVLVHITATALNRADLLQAEGKYPVPPDANPLLGLEMAGTVIALGPGVTEVEVGDNVCALLNGGGFAQRIAVPEKMLLRLPERLSFTKAAAVPEVFLTAFQALHWLAELREGETVLIHAGASGVGTAAIQLVRLAGAVPLVTASAGKHGPLYDLGAERCIDYRSEDFAAVVLEATEGRGVDVVLDFVGGPYLAQNFRALATDGRLVLLGFLGGRNAAAVDLAPVLAKRLQITGTTLRSRSPAYKEALTADFRTRIWPAFATGQLQPVIDTIYDWESVTPALEYLASNANIGKIVLCIGE
ncbi:NAD(P)H-quinone oxidoreductase [Neolewinella lacunae]|uniref:NAD(P)H-quinone oxidoreductase n=1 Tax=Neolewinella lacunae TaxID=1517758 RepID=A0A923PIP2_9BACT|nr:NAD(P)H-quinone oxidoreductase [Neolewinella lacunae]MBC6994019.1 NAD(P)H-quinone oxidoreductase [Neolewinella lacunae]MDN3634689.1 NAD(P)H-quinone oxidoreductase [Neolewinella lacunae]